MTATEVPVRPCMKCGTPLPETERWLCSKNDCFINFFSWEFDRDDLFGVRPWNGDNDILVAIDDWLSQTT